MPELAVFNSPVRKVLRSMVTGATPDGRSDRVTLVGGERPRLYAQIPIHVMRMSNRSVHGRVPPPTDARVRNCYNTIETLGRVCFAWAWRLSLRQARASLTRGR